MKQCPICSRTYPAAEQFCSVHGLPLIEALEMQSDAAGPLSGVVLEDRYRIGGVIGTGGMGTVYEAEQLRVGRRCAVKVLHGGQTAEARVRMRFFREVRSTSRIRHPNVVEIIDFGEDEQVGSYLVMEYLEGVPLSRIITAETPLPLSMVCATMSQLCSALAATHAQGLIHRDLKPSNAIRLDSGLIKVLDFGLVKPLDQSICGEVPPLTTDNMLLGTPWYMSPEHCRGQTLDARSDVYSLGVIFYELLTGQLPYDGAHPLEVIDKQLNAPLPLPSAREPQLKLPPEAEVIMIKAMAKERDARYQSVLELSDACYRLAATTDGDDDERPRLRTRRRSPQPAPSRETLRWAGGPTPSAQPTPPLHRLRTLANERQGELARQIVATLMEALPRYRVVSEAALERRVSAALRDATNALIAEDSRGEGFVYEVGEQDVAGGALSLTEAVTALWLGSTAWRPLLLEAAGHDLNQYMALADQFDQRFLPLFFHLVDRHVTAFEQQLQRLNGRLALRNEELVELHDSLERRIHQTSQQAAEAERLKARVTESVSAGILLIERGSRRVLLWNKALERLSGINAGQVVGETVDQIAHLVEGVPFDEFTEQVTFHGEVGLRKLRVTFRGREQRTVYLRGQPFFDSDGSRRGTLFLLEDVTEREQIIESLGRYLSHDLVTRILSRAGPPEPEGEQRRAVILAARVHHLSEATEEQSPPEVVALLSRYVRAVSTAVFQRGGTLERITPDGLLAYFARFGDHSGSAIEAAVELRGRLEQLGATISAGLHVGDVLVLNVGGDTLMVQTVMGEATKTAEALLAAADEGEVLVSGPLAREAGDLFELEPTASVAVAGRPEPLDTHRVVTRPELEPEPTNVAKG